nr:PREDICTED: waprin-Phi1-like [Anolis carolinensis]|eukprot:XP_016853604.1 PREDICTED: waprin-Phi1-like [Anolis carolinensis]
MKPRSPRSSSLGITQLLFLSLVGLSIVCVRRVDASEQNNVTVAAGKVGTCPENTEVLPASANCTTECQSDAGCEGNAKCCSMGCSKVCRIPDEKPGSCRHDSTGISQLGLCRDTCQNDSQCTGG